MDYSEFAFPKKRKVKNKKAFKDIDCKQCIMCGQKSQHISRHHIIPRSYRRIDDVKNLAPLCEFGSGGSEGCHKLMDSPEWKEYTYELLTLFYPDRIEWLRKQSEDWSFWLYFDDRQGGLKS